MPLIVRAASVKEALEGGAKQLEVPVEHLQAEALADGEFRITFFSAPAHLELQIAPDKLSVSILHLDPPKGAPLPVHMEWVRILSELRQKNIHFGIDEKKIEQAVKTCLQQNTSVRNLEIARGIPAVPGKDAELIQHFVSDLQKPVFAATGDLLITKILALPGKNGTDVFGKAIEAPLGKDLPIQAGAGISVKKTLEPQAKEEYFATQYGKIQFKFNKLEILSPLKVAPDRMKVSIDLQGRSFVGTALNIAMIKPLLESAGINSGIQEKELQTAIANLAQTKSHFDFVCAVGRPAQIGSDGFVEIFKNNKWQTQSSGTWQGWIEKEKDFVHIHPPKAGLAGVDVTGKSLSAKSGEKIILDISKDFQRMETPAHLSIQASQSGFVRIDSESLSWDPIVEISKDEMSAYCDFYPFSFSGVPLNENFIMACLSEAKVSSGILKDRIRDALMRVQKTKAPEKKVLIAQGKAPIPGRDGFLERLWKAPKNPEELLFTKAGECLAILHAPQAGQPGFDVFGKIIPCEEAVALELKVEAGVRTELEKNGDQKLFSTAFGVIRENRENEIGVDWQPKIESQASSASAPLAPKTFTGKPIELADVERALKAHGITYGIRTEHIRKSSKFEPAFVLAKADKPPAIYYYQVDLLFAFNHLSAKNLLAALPDQLSERKAVDLVKANFVLARAKVPPAGSWGSDIFGKPLEPTSTLQLPFELGSGVKFDLQNLTICSEVDPLGYVDFKNRVLSVLPALEVSADRLTAKISVYPPNKISGQTSQMLNESDLLLIFEKFGIKVEPDFDRLSEIRRLVIKTNKPQLSQIVARGFTPADGENGNLKFLVQADLRSGQVREDGSIDFKNRGAVVNVTAGQELLFVGNPTQGSIGQDIFGNQILVKAGAPVQLQEGTNIEKQIVEGGYKLISKINGSFVMAENACSVLETKVVDGDLDLSVGNIHAESSGVIIRGSVLPGFSILAKGEILVEGSIENASLQSEARIVVMGACIGHSCSLKSKTSMELGMLREARVQSKDTIRVRSEVYQADVRSDDRIEVDSSRVIGGFLGALNRIILHDVGTANEAAGTCIAVGKAFASEADFQMELDRERIPEKLKRADAFIQTSRQKLKILGRQKAASVLEARIERIKKWRLELLKRSQGIRTRIQTNSAAVIEIKGRIFPGVSIQIVDQKWMVSEELHELRFKWDAEKNMIVHEPLHEKMK